MAKVIIDMSVSLDGFIAGPADTPDQPIGGRNAQRLHDWLLAGSELYEGSTFLRPPGRNRELVDAMFRTTGALLTGRRTYDLVNGWNGSHPISGLPVVVLTHVPPTEAPKGRSPFTFCSGLQEAVDASQGQGRDGPWRQHDAATPCYTQTNSGCTWRRRCWATAAACSSGALMTFPWR